MLKHLCFSVLVLVCVTSFAQEPLMPVLPENDSTMLEAERQIMYRQLLSGLPPGDNLMEPVRLPAFDLGTGLINRWNIGLPDFTPDQWPVSGWMPGYPGFTGSPFLRDETVFSGAVYRHNDRFSFGGHSFGANSVFTAPFPNQGLNKYNIRGSSLFMQYKVSKNIKIETRVNVIQGPGF